MMPLHSLLPVGFETSRSSHADLNGAGRADRKPAHRDALVVLSSKGDEAQYPVDSFVVTKTIGKEFRNSNHVNDVRHNLPRCVQWEDWNASRFGALQNCDADTKSRGASSLTERKCDKLDARNLTLVAQRNLTIDYRALLFGSRTVVEHHIQYFYGARA